MDIDRGEGNDRSKRVKRKLIGRQSILIRDASDTRTLDVICWKRREDSGRIGSTGNRSWPRFEKSSTIIGCQRRSINRPADDRSRFFIRIILPCVFRSD